MTSTTDPYAWIENALDTVRRAGWYRQTRTLHDRPGAIATTRDRPLVNFASNDYLGLAGDDRLVAAAIAATQALGTGSTGSRLLTGHRELHRELERAIANLKQTEDAIVFSSGYLANVGAIASLVGKRDLILADRYNHASLKSGATLSGATVVTYEHADMADLQKKLQGLRDRHRRCLIATDSVFSMDGDLCPLPEIFELGDRYNCMVLTDDAHATGVFGATGAGVAEHFGRTGRPAIQAGTLSKALGSLGGYVAGSAIAIDFLRNRAATWIYTTGLTPADTAAAKAAIAIVQSEPERRDRLWHNVRYLQERLRDSPDCLQAIPSDSPILCARVPNPQAALAAAQQLEAQGILVAAVRPPTVPTSRLRFSVTAVHEEEHCDRLVAALQEIDSF